MKIAEDKHQERMAEIEAEYQRKKDAEVAEYAAARLVIFEEVRVCFLIFYIQSYILTSYFCSNVV
jgi:hypothetical protein